MQASELRIGNYVYFHGTNGPTHNINKINGTDIGIMENVKKYLNLHSPIELTEQWLKDFGFEKTYAENCYKISLGEFIQHHLYITISEKYNIVTLGDNYGEKEILMVFTLRISEYVHQLQNLYFALTDTELIYKL